MDTSDSLTDPMEFRFNLYPSVEITHLQGSPTLSLKTSYAYHPCYPESPITLYSYLHPVRLEKANFGNRISLPLQTRRSATL